MVGLSVDSLVGWIGGREVVLGGFRTRFRDRGFEVGALLGDLFRFEHVGVVYGPLGAGKSTFLRLFVGGVEELGGVAGVYINYDGGIVDVLYRGVDAFGVRDSVVNAVLNVVASPSGTSVGVSVALGVIVSLMRRLFELVRGWGVDRVVIVHDDLDRWLASRGLGNAIEGLVGLLSNLYEGGPAGVERPWGDKYSVTYVALSDYTAVEVVNRYRGKGGLRAMLMWNLPKEPFMDLILELAGRRDIDIELLWQLLGGNPRALSQLATAYGWDVDAWLRDAINEVVGVLNEEKERLGLGSVGEVLDIVIRRVGQDVGPDNLVLGTPLHVGPLLRNNILIGMSSTAISQLPSEPWVGRHYAYQLPTYYWVVRAMAIRGKVDVKPGDVVSVIRQSI
ncbi:ATP-binding protein [Vulcanisaeta distributa]|nr:ATP-binding protein [Vulcanisaeta distributa]